METVTVSPKYQVVIPSSVRKALGIRPGESIHVIPYENRIEFIPMRKARSMRGFLRGMDTNLSREEDRI